MQWCPVAIHTEPVEKGVGLRFTSSAQQGGVRYVSESLVLITLTGENVYRTHLTESIVLSEAGELSEEKYKELLASCWDELLMVGSYSIGYLSSLLEQGFDNSYVKPFISKLIKEPEGMDARAYFLGMEHASSHLHADPNSAIFLKNLSKPTQGPKRPPEKLGNQSMYS
jgi:hypothetical protein